MKNSKKELIHKINVLNDVIWMQKSRLNRLEEAVFSFFAPDRLIALMLFPAFLWGFSKGRQIGFLSFFNKVIRAVLFFSAKRIKKPLYQLIYQKLLPKL